jgi:hypothetical protein
MSKAERWIILRRVLMIWGTLIFMRGCTVLLTSFPDPYPECQKRAPGTQAWSSLDYGMVIEEAILMWGPNEKNNSLTCGDMMFSGHTTLLSMIALIWHHYFPKVNRVFNPIKIVILMICLTGSMLLVVGRIHYLLDVVVALYLSVTLWASYHSYVTKVISGNIPDQQFFLDGVIIVPIIGFVETGCFWRFVRFK